MVFPSGGLVGVKSLIIPNVEDSIHLYDSPPCVKPSDNQMICFASPNFSWFDGIRKSNHRTIYMPPWTLDELFEANETLQLDIEEKVVESRFHYFWRKHPLLFEY